MNNNIFRELLYSKDIIKYSKKIVEIFADTDMNHEFNYTIVISKKYSSIQIKTLLISKDTINNFLNNIDNVKCKSTLSEYEAFHYIINMLDNLKNSLNNLKISIEKCKEYITKKLKNKCISINKLYGDAITLMMNTKQLTYYATLDNKILLDIFLLFGDYADIIHEYRLIHYFFDYYLLYYNNISTKKIKLNIKSDKIFTIEIFKTKTNEMLNKFNSLLSYHWNNYLEEYITSIQLQSIIDTINIMIIIAKKYNNIHKVKLLENKKLILTHLLSYIYNIDNKISIITNYLKSYVLFTFLAERIQLL